MIIDLFEFARQREQASGLIGWASLARVDTPARDGKLSWAATGSMGGRHGVPQLDLEVTGTAILICQRCLQPMQEAVVIDRKFLIAADEAHADELDQDDDYDVVVGSTSFDLATLIEDEVILALPSAPRHLVCPGRDDDESKAATRPSPFAVLASLKSDSRDPGETR
jgi:uncharacterized protein